MLGKTVFGARSTAFWSGRWGIQGNIIIIPTITDSLIILRAEKMGFRLRVLHSKHITKRYGVGKRNEGGGVAHRVGARGQGKDEGRCGREAAELVKVGRELSAIIARGTGSTSCLSTVLYICALPIEV